MEPYDLELPSTDKFINPVAYKSLRSRHRQKQRHPTIHSMKSMYCSLSVCSILVALIGLSYLLFDPIVKYVVLKRLVLRNESDFAELWQNPPITPHFKVYFFNLTNPEEFFTGKAVPHLEEVGPYTYHQKWIKENVTWHNNGTMSYSTRKEFKFMPELSVGDQSGTNLTTINVPLLSAYYQSRKSWSMTKWGMDAVFENMGMKAWVKKTPEQLIWGYQEDLFDLAKTYLPDPPPMDKFGYFTKKNQSDNLNLYTMYTGSGNPYNLSKISLFNGKNTLGIWSEDENSGSTCNKVQGSDGATFNPYIQKDETLWFFNDQLCRSLPLVFEKKVKSRGDMPGYRFVPREDVFKLDFDKFPQNKCFCDGEELCEIIGDGMFAVPKCQQKAPIILSWPHFLHANETFRSMVTGMKPADPEKHGFWFDVQPTTGTTLSAKARVQINIGVRKDESFTGIQHIKDDTIVPLLWFEEGIEELGDELLDVIGEAVTQPPMYKKYILFMLLGVCIPTTCVIFVALTRFCMNLRAERVNLRHQNLENMKIRNLLQGSGASNSSQGKNQLANFKRGHAHNPSQGSGKFLLESEDSSRHHSRNSSTGSNNIPTSNIVVNVDPDLAVQNNELASQQVAEAERLLSDQRSSE